MKHEIESLERGAGLESRAEEGRLLEDSTERPLEGLDEVDQRSTIARFLYQSTFPATKEALVRDAQENSAYDWVLERLRRLPEGEQFENVQAVWESLGGRVERRF
ncbi:MAG: DUF2795 domain-containing protein [Actinomycetota bacterium]|nr:DUF2795 domain-containing protein [Actinomycetota bacterium]